MMPIRRVAVLAVFTVFIGIGTSCAAQQESGGGEEVEELPTTSIALGDGAVEVFPTAADLIRNSYVVARGRFVGGPTTVESSPEGEEFARSLVVWEFVPDEVYRDVRLEDAPAKVAESRRKSILVAVGVNQVGVMRGDQSIESFVDEFPSEGNLNSFPVDRPLYVFLSPGAVSKGVVERNAELAHVMIVTAHTHCYLVDDLDRSCAAVADTPGGEPRAVLEEGALVPRGLSPEAIEGAGALSEVVEHASGDGYPTIDTERFDVLPGGGGEG